MRNAFIFKEIVGYLQPFSKKHLQHLKLKFYASKD